MDLVRVGRSRLVYGEYCVFLGFLVNALGNVLYRLVWDHLNGGHGTWCVDPRLP